MAERSDVARGLITDVIANAHAAIKSCWLIVFSAGTAKALTTINDNAVCQGILSSKRLFECNDTSEFYLSVVLFFIYILTFIRFYLGDIRIFDIRYVEIYKIFNSIFEKSDERERQGMRSDFKEILAFNDRNFHKFEVVWLIIQSLIVVSLCFNINNVENFSKIYALLLISNAAWLVANNKIFLPSVTNFFINKFPEALQNSTISGMFPRAASYVWIKNNIVHFLFICFAIENKNSYTEIILISIMISNCLFDLFMARNFYFPKFSNFYQKLLDSKE